MSHGCSELWFLFRLHKYNRKWNWWSWRQDGKSMEKMWQTSGAFSTNIWGMFDFLQVLRLRLNTALTTPNIATPWDLLLGICSDILLKRNSRPTQASLLQPWKRAARINGTKSNLRSLHPNLCCPTRDRHTSIAHHGEISMTGELGRLPIFFTQNVLYKQILNIPQCTFKILAPCYTKHVCIIQAETVCQEKYNVFNIASVW